MYGIKRTTHLPGKVKHINYYYSYFLIFNIFNIFNFDSAWYVKKLGENKTKVIPDGYVDIKMLYLVRL